MDIKRVLIVLNKLQDMQSTIERGFDFVNKFNARTEVLYVHETPLFDIKELYTDNEFNENIVKSKIKELIKSKTKEDIAIFVKIDDTQDRIWDLIRDDKETIIVTNYHKDITLKITDSCKQPIYIIKQNSKIEKIAFVFEELTNVNEPLEFLKNSIGSDITLIYNFNYMPNIDPVDPLVSSAYVDNELLLQTQEELFSNLKNEYNLNGKMFINLTNEDGELIDYLNSSNYSCVALGNVEDSIILSTKDELIKSIDRDLIIL